jgi:predicted MFS family arabinose efflux permease
VALAVGAAAPTYLVLLLALLPAGVAAAAANPATNRVLAELPGRRGALTGVKQSGVHVGALIAGGLMPLLAAWFGWRGAFAALGILCLSGVALLSWLPEREGAPPTHAEPTPDTQRPAATVGEAPIRHLAMYSFCTGAGVNCVMTFLPLYGEERLGLGQTAAGMLLALMAAIGLASSVAWTLQAERRAHAGGGSPLTIMSAGAVVATGLIAAGPALGTWSVWVASLVFGLTAVPANAVVMLTLVTRAAPGEAGRASGRVLTAFFVGLCVSGPLFGAVVELTGYVGGWLLTVGAFVAAASAAMPLRRAEHI